MEKLIVIIILVFGFNLKAYCQIKNVYFYSVENKNTNDDLNTLSHFIYLDTKLKFDRFKIFHYTPAAINDTTWVNKKKEKVVYKNSKIDCDFLLKEQFLRICEANRLNENDPFTNYLLISSENKSLLEQSKQFKISEINTNSELSIQKEVNRILTESGKENVNIYIFQNSFQSSKPIFQFAKDTIVGNGLVDIGYKTSSKVKDFVFSPAEKVTNNVSAEKLSFNLKSNLILKGYYIDENGCKSNQDEISLSYVENCNCDNVREKPEILYARSPNILKKEDDEEADWDYKLIPEGPSGSLSYEFAIKNVCAEKFVVEIEDSKGKILTKQYFERNEIDERSSNPLAVNNKDMLVFLLNLDDKRNEIIPTDALFFIKIIPELQTGECIKRKYISQKVRFSKCR